jgi:hypothetical protein
MLQVRIQQLAMMHFSSSGNVSISSRLTRKWVAALQPAVQIPLRPASSRCCKRPRAQRTLHAGSGAAAGARARHAAPALSGQQAAKALHVEAVVPEQ